MKKKKQLKVNPLFIRQIKLLLLPVATILIVVILGSRFLLPKISQFQENFSKNKQDRSQLDLLLEKEQKLTELKNSSLVADFERIEMILPSEKKIPFVISSISLLEKENGVLFERFTINPGLLDEKNGKEEKGGTSNSKSLDFTISFIGAEDSVLNFMEKLLLISPLMNIRNVSININNGIYKVTAAVSTFHQNLPKTLGKIDSPLKAVSPSQKKTAELIKSFVILEEIPEEIIEEASPSSQQEIEKGVFEL